MKLYKKSSKKWLAVIIAVLVIALIAGGLYFYMNRRSADSTGSADAVAASDLPAVNEVNYGPATEEEKQEGEKTKQELAVAEKTQPESSSIHASFTRANQNSQGSPVYLAAIVSGANDGVCEFTFSKNSVNFAKTAPVKFDGGARCTLEVPVADFNETGNWTASVIVKKDGAQSSASQIQFEVKK